MDVLSEQRTYVAGRWVTGDEVLSVENPADESHVANVSVTPQKEIERAVIQACRSLDEGVWAQTPASERARVLRAFASGLAAHGFRPRPRADGTARETQPRRRYLVSRAGRGEGC